MGSNDLLFDPNASIMAKAKVGATTLDWFSADTLRVVSGIPKRYKFYKDCFILFMTWKLSSKALYLVY